MINSASDFGDYIVSEEFDLLLDRFYHEFRYLVESENIRKSLQWAEIGLMAGNVPTWGYIKLSDPADCVKKVSITLTAPPPFKIRANDIEYESKYKSFSLNTFSLTKVLYCLHRADGELIKHDKIYCYCGDVNAVKGLISVSESDEPEFNLWKEKIWDTGEIKSFIFFPMIWSGQNQKLQVVGAVFFALSAENEDLDEALRSSFRIRAMLNLIAGTKFCKDVARYTESPVVRRIAGFIETAVKGPREIDLQTDSWEGWFTGLNHDRTKMPWQISVLIKRFGITGSYNNDNFKGMFETRLTEDAKEKAVDVKQKNSRRLLPIDMVKEVLCYFLSKERKDQILFNVNNGFTKFAMPIAPGWLFLASLADALNDFEINDDNASLKINMFMSEIPDGSTSLYGISFCLPNKPDDSVSSHNISSSSRLWSSLHGVTRAGATTRRLQDLVHICLRKTEYNFSSDLREIPNRNVKWIWEGFAVPVVTYLLTDRSVKDDSEGCCTVKLLWLGPKSSNKGV